ncbi:MAG: DUF1501 domain-containing protein [Pannonibacter indicus]
MAGTFAETISGMTRRGFLTSACCAAAAPLFTPLALAAMPGDNRFAAIILRGAMDGLDLVQPVGDKAFASLRPKLVETSAPKLIPLDDFFGLHPAAAPLLPLWKAGELAFVHVVSTPYRNIRSHFDGQDILEAGGTEGAAKTGGWLNRTLSLTGAPLKAISVSTAQEVILSGANPADVWSPRSDIALGQDELNFLAELYKGDRAFSEALKQAVGIDSFTDALYANEKRNGSVAHVARMAGALLKDEYRIASFSITGWDTHVQQEKEFASAVKDLSTAILSLRDEMGPKVWAKTAVVAMTEFGRTVRQNANDGTDHGTGGCCVIAGGAIRGGKVYGRWPGLGDGDLLDDRDLNPTGDVRAVAAALLASQFGLKASALTDTVFPGLDFSGKPRFT